MREAWWVLSLGGRRGDAACDVYPFTQEEWLGRGRQVASSVRLDGDKVEVEVVMRSLDVRCKGRNQRGLVISIPMQFPGLGITSNKCILFRRPSRLTRVHQLASPFPFSQENEFTELCCFVTPCPTCRGSYHVRTLDSVAI